jgi:hypothetical protein
LYTILFADAEDNDLILQINRERGRARRISYIFEKKKEGRRTYQALYRTLVIRALVIDHNNEAPSAHGLPFLQRDCSRGALRD